MRKTEVVNLKNYHPNWHNHDYTYTYIGRPSKWGNPFKVGVDGTREEVIQQYKEWLCFQNELYDAIHTELKGKTLGCWCAPLACHGDILAAIAEGDLVLMPYA